MARPSLGKVFILVALVALCLTPPSEGKPKKGLKRKIGIGVLGGAVAGAAIAHAMKSSKPSATHEPAPAPAAVPVPAVVLMHSAVPVPAAVPVPPAVPVPAAVPVSLAVPAPVAVSVRPAVPVPVSIPVAIPVIQPKTISKPSSTSFSLPLFETGPTEANGCYKETTRQLDPSNHKAYIETVRYKCPTINRISIPAHGILSGINVVRKPENIILRLGDSSSFFPTRHQIVGGNIFGSRHENVVILSNRTVQIPNGAAMRLAPSLTISKVSLALLGICVVTFFI